jgi:alanine-glyoxylate transaminase/serine-glyoxylate transaminase/serine-pyruvate transaminase
MGMGLLGHLDPDFIALMDETQTLLRYVYQTENRLTMAVSGTGSAGMEATVVNLIEPGDPVLVCIQGFFGARIAEMADRAGGNVATIERPFGEAFSPDEVRDAVRRVKPKVLFVVHAETSAGVLQPVTELARIAHEADALIAIDTVTSLGCVPVEIDAWNIDAAFSCSQKGLSCPPGLAPLTFGSAAMEVLNNRRTKVRNWYLDLSLISKYWGGDRAYHHTAPISMNYALREGLALVVDEGLDARHARHLHNAAAFKAGLTAMGISYVAAEGFQLPQLHCVRIPQGIDDLTVRKRLLTDWGIEVGGGLGNLKGKAWRIGLMGQGSRQIYVTLLLAALETCLRDLGCPIKPGAGLAASAEAYARSEPVPASVR